MSFEYQMLVFMTLFYMLAWLPASIAKLQSFGGKWLASNREPAVGKELVPWGGRAERAYANLKDYFPGFIVAVILLGTLNKFDQGTAWAAGLYVGGRVVHFVSYTTGSVNFRFISYVTAMIANFYLLIKIL